MALRTGSSAANGRRARGARRSVCFAVLAALLCAAASHGQVQVAEASLKSAFLYKFLHYADWPDDALGAPDDPIALCVIGNDDLAAELEHVVHGRTSHGRPLAVRNIDGVDEVGGCHVLFVDQSEFGHLDRLIERVAAKPILTVGGAEGFADRGGVINFKRSEARLGFQINRGAAQRAGIELSSQLLKLAELVSSGGDDSK